MANNLPKATFAQVVNHPVTYALMVVVSLLSFFVYAYTGSNDRAYKDCQDDNKRKDERIENLTNAILYYKGIKVEIEKRTDSLVREKVGNDAKEIIETTK